MTALESSLFRSNELMRGFQHSEIDTGWVIEQMKTHLVEAYGVLLSMERRVAP